MINNSTEHGYEVDIARLKRRMAARGYPIDTWSAPLYDVSKREDKLKRLSKRHINVHTVTLHARRVFEVSSATLDNSKCNFVALKLPFGVTFSNFNMKSEIASLFLDIGINRKPLLIHTVSGSSFLKTYKLNFPYSPM